MKVVRHTYQLLASIAISTTAIGVISALAYGVFFTSGFSQWLSAGISKGPALMTAFGLGFFVAALMVTLTFGSKIVSMGIVHKNSGLNALGITLCLIMIGLEDIIGFMIGLFATLSVVVAIAVLLFNIVIGLLLSGAIIASRAYLLSEYFD